MSITFQLQPLALVPVLPSLLLLCYPGWGYLQVSLHLFYQVMKSIEDGYRLPPPVDCPAPLYELMKNCWAYDRARRPHFLQLQAHLEQLLTDPHSLRTIANFDPR